MQIREGEKRRRQLQKEKEAFERNKFTLTHLDELAKSSKVDNLLDDIFMSAIPLGQHIRGIHLATTLEYINLFKSSYKDIQRNHVFKYLVAQGVLKDLQGEVQNQGYLMAEFTRPMYDYVQHLAEFKIQLDDEDERYIELHDPKREEAANEHLKVVESKYKLLQFAKEFAVEANLDEDGTEFSLGQKIPTTLIDNVLVLIDATAALTLYMDTMVRTTGLYDIVGILKESKTLVEYATESPRILQSLAGKVEQVNESLGFSEQITVADKSRLDQTYSDEDEERRKEQLERLTEIGEVNGVMAEGFDALQGFIQAKEDVIERDLELQALSNTIKKQELDLELMKNKVTNMQSLMNMLEKQERIAETAKEELKGSRQHIELLQNQLNKMKKYKSPEDVAKEIKELKDSIPTMQEMEHMHQDNEDLRAAVRSNEKILASLRSQLKETKSDYNKLYKAYKQYDEAGSWDLMIKAFERIFK